MAGALNGIRVIDFGQYIAGPLAAMILADQGAEVIRVDPPGGPRWQTPANATWNRNKKSIVLDLKQAADNDTARRLIEGADIVIENFRPGVMDRLGLGPDTMTASNRRLIYTSMPGFASDDPRAAVAAYEGVVLAATDGYRVMMPEPGEDPAKPVYMETTTASNFAAFHGAIAITMALIVRERDGRGQRIEVPLFDAMFDAMGAAGQKLPGNAARRAGGPSATYRDYQCKDGRWIYFGGAMPRFLDWLIDAAGVSHWRQEGFTDRARVAGDPQLSQELYRRMREMFMTRTALEWEDLGKKAGFPLTLLRTRNEWIDHPHARASKGVIEVNDPEFGPMWQPGYPVSLAGTPPSTEPRHPLDADRAEVLAGLSSPAASANGGGGESRPAALAGMRILDLTQVFAGPTMGRILAEYGAEVIKINNPHDANVMDHLHLNRAKRTMLLDLQSPEGLDVLYKLIDSSNAFLQNFAFGQSDKLGFGYDKVSARKPGIVYGSVSAYNYDGPWAAGRGYEPLGRATTGMSARTDNAQPSRQAVNAIVDYGTGALGALAVTLGLFHQVRTGEGQHVQASLAQTAVYHQSPSFYRYEGRVWETPKDTSALGEGPLYRIYRAGDGYFFLAAGPSQLSRVEGLAAAQGLTGDALSAALEAAFATAPAEEWVQRLVRAGAGAHRLVKTDEFMEDPWVKAHGLSLTRETEGVGMVRTTGPASARLSRTPVQAGNPARPAGADGPAILGELGLGSRVGEFADKRIIVGGVPEAAGVGAD